MPFFRASFLLAVAALIERRFGYPDRVFSAIGHPVTWIGHQIAWAERHLNRPYRSRRTRIALGALACLGQTASAVLAARLLGRLPFAMRAVLAGTLIAQRSLETHVAAVADALETGGIEAGRAAVSQIVGRDPAVLDEAAVARAALESLAENFSDGIVAPILWGAAFGLPGIAFYKAINTADSMIGHRSPRYEAYGKASARLDDLVNLPASRLSALLLALASGRKFGAVWRGVRRDARLHRSPNAGWPEAAMATGLDVSLAGPRIYDGVRVDDHWMGRGRSDLGPADIRAGLVLYRRACSILIAGLGVMAFGRTSFSEEKEAKRLYSFQSLGTRPFQGSRPTKVFCFFFSKKKAGRRPPVPPHHTRRTPR